MYEMKVCRRTNMATIEVTYEYFNSEESLEKYRDKFNKYLYEENYRFISETGKAEFNDAGILIRK